MSDPLNELTEAWKWGAVLGDQDCEHHRWSQVERETTEGVGVCLLHCEWCGAEEQRPVLRVGDEIKGFIRMEVDEWKSDWSVVLFEVVCMDSARIEFKNSGSVEIVNRSGFRSSALTVTTWMSNVGTARLTENRLIDKGTRLCIREQRVILDQSPEEPS